MTAGSLPIKEEFVHPAYSRTQEYVDHCMEFIQEGPFLAEPVAVAVPGENVEILRTALGTTAQQVHGSSVNPSGPGVRPWSIRRAHSMKLSSTWPSPTARRPSCAPTTSAAWTPRRLRCPAVTSDTAGCRRAASQLRVRPGSHPRTLQPTTTADAPGARAHLRAAARHDLVPGAPVHHQPRQNAWPGWRAPW
jgi:hypothetical protein